MAPLLDHVLKIQNSLAHRSVNVPAVDKATIEQGFIWGGGGGGEGALAPPPLRVATIHMHNIRKLSSLSIEKSCLNQVFYSFLTCKLSLASHSAREGAHPPPTPTP